MDTRGQFCHNARCWAYGRAGEGHIVIHSRTFAATRSTALYRAHKPHDLVVQIVTLLAHGCPVQAIVVTFGLDERTVARYQAEAGAQCRRVHEHVVEAGRAELGQVQADELRVRIVGGVLWVAMALTVTSRLWLGGVVSARRDGPLIRVLLQRVQACGATRAVLLCVAGWCSYVTQARRVFRAPVRTGRMGRPRLALPADVLIAQVVKWYAKHRAARQAATVEAGRWLVGICYNCCWPHRSLRRRRTAADPPGGKWVERTPAQAAGLADRCWSLHQLLTFPVPPPPLRRRGRRPRWLRDVARAA